jgi:hypothetical protein
MTSSRRKAERDAEISAQKSYVTSLLNGRDQAEDEETSYSSGLLNPQARTPEAHSIRV